MYSLRELTQKEFPPSLREIPQPPKKLFIAGTLPMWGKTLAVVGARKYSPYGKEACASLIHSLKGQPITIVSGLALGIDSIAHASALEAGLHTIAVPGSGLDPAHLYPRANIDLAKRILEKGGCLISEFEPEVEAAMWTFPKRNRIMAGLSDAVLIIEAAEKSGTLITARLATDYNKTVLTVPGSIFSPNSSGAHQLLRLGATPATCSNDILEALGLESGEPAFIDESKYGDCSKDEMRIIDAIRVPQPREDVLQMLEMSVQEFNALVGLLEIKGFVEEKGGELFRK
jgi:DNA processing protein